MTPRTVSALPSDDDALVISCGRILGTEPDSLAVPRLGSLTISGTNATIGRLVKRAESDLADELFGVGGAPPRIDLSSTLNAPIPCTLIDV